MGGDDDIAPVPTPATTPATTQAIVATLPGSIEATQLAGSAASSPATTLTPITGAEETLAATPELRAAVLAAARRPPPQRDTPLRIGRYLVIAPLGEGGMGVVFAAYDPQLDRKVAIKLVRPAYTESSGGEAQARLLREAQALARLRHPNIVTVYEVGAFGDEVYVAMEFVDGVTLRVWQFEHARSWREIVRVYQAAGRGLAAAHHAGLVHRDFKPDNVLVTAEGEARVLDFGLAFRDASATVAAPTGALADGALTMTGALVGTPAYMSPEQFRSQPVDARTDIFAFSVALYEALYGSRPFAGGTVAEICVSLFEGRVSSPPPFVRVPKWLRRVLLRGLRVEPKDRPADMDTVVRALGRDPARYAIVASVVLVVAGVIVALVLALRSAEGLQVVRDEGARVRAEFDEQRAAALEADLLARSQRAAADHYNEWIVAAARGRLDASPMEALAALKHLNPAGERWAGARGVAAEAVARGVPVSSWPVPGVTALVFADDDRWLISGDAQGRVEVRAREGGPPVASMTQAAAITGLAAAVAGRSGERPGLRVAALAGEELALWDVVADRVHRVEDVRAPILAFTMTRDGERVALGDADGRLRIHKWTGELLHSYVDHGAPVTAVAWSSDAERLASGAEDGRVIAWKLVERTHNELGRLRAPIRSLRFDDAQSELYAIGSDGGGVVYSAAGVATRELSGIGGIRFAERVRLEVDLQGEVALHVLGWPARRLAAEAPPEAVALAASGQWAALAHARGVELWDARARRVRSLAGARLRFEQLAWSPRGRWIAASSDEGGLQLWRLEDGARVGLRAGGPAIAALFFTPDEGTLIVADRKSRLFAWDLAADPPTARELPLVGGFSPDVYALPLIDGGVLQWFSNDHIAQIQALSPTGESLWRSPTLEGIAVARLSADGRRLALAQRRGGVDLFRVEHGQLLREAIELGGAGHRWKAIADTPDGGRTRLAALLPGAGEGASLVVWEVAWQPASADAVPTPHLLYEDDEVRDILVDASGDAMIVRGREHDHLWHLPSGRIDRLPRCPAELHGFALAAGGRVALLAGSDGGRSVSDVACRVDLESKTHARLPLSGEPWAWDGGRTLASVYRGSELDLWVDPVPGEPAEFARWLAEQTARELPLTALEGAKAPAR